MAKKEYIEKNRQWLADKAQETGVKPLPKGIYYKIIASGDKDGRKPSARSVVTAHYTGRTINGRTFDSSRGGSPLATRHSRRLHTNLRHGVAQRILTAAVSGKRQ